MFFVLVQLLVRGITFLTTPIYTRLVSTTQYGQIRIYESWLLIAVPVMSLCLYRSIARAKFEFPDRFDDYVSSTLALSFCSIAAFSLILSLFCRAWFTEFTGMNTLMYVYMLLFVFANTGLYFYQNKEKQLMRYRQSTRITALTMIPATALSILLLYLGNVTGHQDSLVDLRVIGFYTPQIVGGAIAVVILLRSGRCLFNRAFWKFGLVFSLPLIPELLSIQIMNQSDKIMIQKMVDDASAGLFSLGTTVSFIIWIIEDAVWYAWLPWLYEKISRNEKEDIERPWFNIVYLFGLISWGLVALAPEIVLFLGGKRYAESVFLIAPMVTGTLFRFFSYCYTAIQGYHKKNQYVAIGTVGVMFVNVALNAVCIHLFGYQAAAYTTAVSYLLLLFVQGCLEKKICGERIVPLNRMMLLSTAFFAVNVLTILTYSWSWYARYGLILAVVLVCAKFLLPTVKQLLSQIKTKK